MINDFVPKNWGENKYFQPRQVTVACLAVSEYKNEAEPQQYTVDEVVSVE